MAAGQVTLQSRAMVGRAFANFPVEVMSVRVVQAASSGRWCVQQEHGPGLWIGMSYYETKRQAYAEATSRREKYLAFIICPECDGALGVDESLTCSDCGFTGREKPAPAKEPLIPMWYVVYLLMGAALIAAAAGVCIWAS